MEIDRYLLCPISKMIFNKPVIAEDGETYEKFFIKNWLSSNSTSPINGRNMGKELKPNNIMKRIVNEFLEKNPEMVEEQYEYEVDVRKVLENKKYNKLLKCKDFSFSDIEYNLWVQFFRTAEQKHINHIIDNWNDIEDCISTPSDKYDINHIIFSFGNLETVKYIFSKHKNLLINTEKLNQTPLHLACQNNTLSVIKYIVSEYNDLLEQLDINYFKPIHYVFSSQPNETIEWFMSLDIDKTSTTKFGASIYDLFKINPHKTKIKELNVMTNELYKNSEIPRYIFTFTNFFRESVIYLNLCINDIFNKIVVGDGEAIHLVFNKPTIIFFSIDGEEEETIIPGHLIEFSDNSQIIQIIINTDKTFIQTNSNLIK